MPQAKNFVLSGGAAIITAPNGGQVFRLIGTAPFNFTYADFSAGGRSIGSAAAAVAWGSNYLFDVLAPLGSAFSVDQVIGFVSSGGVQTVSCVPVINANKPVVLQTNGATNGDQSKLNIAAAGNLIATDDGSGKVTLSDNTSGTKTAAILVETATLTPSSASTAGVTGQIAWDSGFIYICTAGGTAGNATWKKAALVAAA